MKNKLKLMIAAAVVEMACKAAFAQTAATLVDLGAGAPTPGANDVSQLLTGGGSPPGLNYYFNSAPPIGQTFTTGANPNGYALQTLSVNLAGNYGGIPGGGQSYYLRIYSVSGTNATLMATYASQASSTFALNNDEWIQFTNLTGVAFEPSSQYAYTFGDAINGSGYENVGNVSGDPYTGGQACAIPAVGGPITFSSATNTIYDASFDVGLSVISALTANPIAFSPGNIVSSSQAVTLSVQAFGPGPIGYKWYTDGGTGGGLTNIASAHNASYSPNIASLPLGSYQFQVVATNTSQSVTSAVATLVIDYPTVAAPFDDIGTKVALGPFDIYQTTGGGNGDGLNYYNNNGANNGYYCGQTFTTGTNSPSYTLNTMAVRTGDGGYAGDGSAFVALPYNLYIFTVKGSVATLLASYTNSPDTTNTFGDWLQWSNLSLTLKSNTVYAYGVGNASGGYEAFSTSPNTTDLYPGGQIAQIPPVGGQMLFGTSGKADAVFALGLSANVVPAYPVASPIAVSPSYTLTDGTPLNLSEDASGNATLHYHWQTDGGSGGALTNIPATDASNLVFNTTGLTPGVYQFDVVVTNTSGSTTSTVAAVTLTYANATATLTDFGASAPTPGPDDISQLLNSGSSASPPGLNYYFNNSPPSGETFTTGTFPAGYELTSLNLQLAGNSGNLPGGGQSYVLQLFSINNANSTATLYATYTSQNNFVFAANTDWLKWTGFAVPLAANTTYAYTLLGNDGYCAMASVAGNQYPNGQACAIPAVGGAVTYSSTPGYNGTFDLGLTPQADLTITPAGGGSYVVKWSQGTLLSSATPAGPYSIQVVGPPYSYTFTPAANTRKFFKVQVQ